MPDWLLSRLGPLAGGLGSLLLVAGLLVAEDVSTRASPDDSGATIATVMADGADSTRLGVSLALVGAFLFLWFAGYLRVLLDGWLGAVALAGGVLSIAGLLPYLAVLVAESSEYITSNPEGARFLLLFEWEYAGVVSPGLAALVASASIGAIRGRLLPLWLVWGAWLGLPLAAALAFGGFLGGFLVMLALIWILAFAAALLVTPRMSIHADRRARHLGG